MLVEQDARGCTANYAWYQDYLIWMRLYMVFTRARMFYLHMQEQGFAIMGRKERKAYLQAARWEGVGDAAASCRSMASAVTGSEKHGRIVTRAGAPAGHCGLQCLKVVGEEDLQLTRQEALYLQQVEHQRVYTSKLCFQPGKLIASCARAENLNKASSFESSY